MENPFKQLDHVREKSEGLRERVIRSAQQRRSLLAMAGMFSGDFIRSIFGLVGGEPGPRKKKRPND